MGLTRGEGIPNVMCASTSEYNDIEKRIGTETIGTMNGYTGSFTSGVETRHDLILAVFVDCDYLTGVLGRDTTHCERKKKPSESIVRECVVTYCYNGLWAEQG